MVGYSRLTGVDEEATLATLKAYHKVIGGPVVGHQGAVFGWQQAPPTGFAAEFLSSRRVAFPSSVCDFHGLGADQRMRMTAIFV